MIDVSSLILNYQETSNFYLEIDKLPELKYYLSDIALPDVSIGVTSLDTPFVQIKDAGLSLEFSPLTCTFFVDENLKNYKEIWYWMLSFKEDFSTLSAADLSTTETRIEKYSEDHYGNLKLYILTNQKNIKNTINFYGVFPTNLSALSFSSKQDHQIIICDVTFQYTNYMFEEITV